MGQTKEKIEIHAYTSMLDLSTVDRKDIEILRKFVGLQGIAYLHAILRNGNMRPKDERVFQLYRQIDSEFLKNFGRIYQVPENMSEHFFIQAMLLANESMKYLMKILKLPELVVGLHNEIEPFPNTITKMLGQFGKDPQRNFKEFAPIVQFETARLMMLTMVAANVQLAIRENRLHPWHRDLNDAITDELYVGDVGKTQEVDIYTIHESETNTLVSVHYSLEDAKQFCEPRMHIKCTPFKTRPTRFGFPVLQHSRTKTEVTAVLKAVLKTLHTNGETHINTHKHIQDHIGFQFITFDGEIQRTGTADYIMDITTNTGMRHTALGVPEFIPKHKGYEQSRDEKIYRGQSPSGTFKRWYAYFPGIDTPLELMFKTLPEHFNSVYEVGEKDKNGTYTGDAHDLYELKRYSQLAQFLFPQTYYGLDIEAHMHSRMNMIADELRQQNRV